MCTKINKILHCFWIAFMLCGDLWRPPNGSTNVSDISIIITVLAPPTDDYTIHIEWNTNRPEDVCICCLQNCLEHSIAWPPKTNPIVDIRQTIEQPFCYFTLQMSMITKINLEKNLWKWKMNEFPWRTFYRIDEHLGRDLYWNRWSKMNTKKNNGQRYDKNTNVRRRNKAILNITSLFTIQI